MIVGVDTNVLVRYLVLDDPGQSEAATKILEDEEEIAISTAALCETAWVLQRRYRFASADVAKAIAALVAPSKIKVDRATVRAGLDMLDRGGDFADGCIVAEARQSGCT